MLKQFLFIGLYLIAIVLANIFVGIFGTIAVIPVGFCLVGLDITTRDTLHELWKTKRWLKMGLLIAFGSLISWLLNRDVAQIALASFVAFTVSAILDTLVYTKLYKRYYLIKVNGSNLFSSFSDSVLFISIAFGAFMPLLIFEQFMAKFIGGILWSLLLKKTFIEKSKKVTA
ncbi:MAG: VUT family protein [Lutibacter sp.]|jgi:hypothetical protein